MENKHPPTGTPESTLLRAQGDVGRTDPRERPYSVHLQFPAPHHSQAIRGNPVYIGSVLDTKDIKLNRLLVHFLKINVSRGAWVA